MILEPFLNGQEISYINLPVKYLDGDGVPTVVVEPWPILDIHDTMSFLFDEAHIKIPGVKLKEYWQRSKEYGEPWAEGVPEEEMHYTVPIGIYGDSARIDLRFGQEHIAAFFANIILWRPRSVRWSRFLICAIPEERLTSETIPTILRRITWSANHAYYGFFPRTDHMGHNLEGIAKKREGKALTRQNLKFQVTELRGDWVFHKKIWNFHRAHWNGEEVCHLCSAKGRNGQWAEMYWNIENNNHTEFSLPQFLARRMPARRIWT